MRSSNFLHEEDIPHPFSTMREYQIGRRIEKYRKEMNVASLLGMELAALEAQNQMDIALDDMKRHMESEGHVFGKVKGFDDSSTSDNWGSL